VLCVSKGLHLCGAESARLSDTMLALDSQRLQ
jgi:hypothetical protein